MIIYFKPENKCYSKTYVYVMLRILKIYERLEYISCDVLLYYVNTMFSIFILLYVECILNKRKHRIIFQMEISKTIEFFNGKKKLCVRDKLVIYTKVITISIIK